MSKTPKQRSLRVFRGGSWYYVPQGARFANRGFFVPDARFSYLGVRLVEVIDE